MQLVNQVKHRILKPELILDGKFVRQANSIVTLHLAKDKDINAAKIIALCQIIQETDFTLVLSNNVSWILKQLEYRLHGWDNYLFIGDLLPFHNTQEVWNMIKEQEIKAICVTDNISIFEYNKEELKHRNIKYQEVRIYGFK